MSNNAIQTESPPAVTPTPADVARLPRTVARPGGEDVQTAAVEGTEAEAGDAADPDADADPSASVDIDELWRTVKDARRDAARYRRELREATAESDELRAQLDADRRAIIDWRASSTTNVAPALLDAAGIDVAALLDDNGRIDIGKVDQFVATVEKKFHVAQEFKPNRGQGASASATPPSKTLADAFRPR